MLQGNIGTPKNVMDLIRSVNVQVSGHGQFARFQRMYAHDRIAFVYDCLPALGRTLAEYQEEILGYFDEGARRVAVRGPHGLGKTALASVLTHHSVLTAMSDCKVPTTASAWRQLEKYLWPEIKKTNKFLDWIEIGRPPYNKDELLTQSIRLKQGTVEAFAVASDDHTTIEGAHATRMVYVFDEAKTIPRGTWDAAEGAFSSEGLEISDYQAGESGVSISKEVRERIRRSASKEAASVLEDLRTGKYGRSNIGQVVGSNGASVGGINGGYVEGDVVNGVARVDRDVEAYAQLKASGTLSSRSTPLSTLPPTSPRSTSAPPPMAHDRSQIQDSAIQDHRQSTIVSTSDRVYEAIAFAISTPGDPSGQFYDIHMHKPGYEDWKTRHVTVDEAIMAGRISRAWVDQRALQWGVDSSVFLNRVLGEFADNTEEGVIPLSWVRAAMERWKDWAARGYSGITGKRTLGVDTARGGEDKTVIAARIGRAIHQLHIYSKLRTTQTAGHVTRLARDHDVHIEIDGGLGASVYDIMREDGVKRLKPITVGGKTLWTDKSKELSFLNVRAAMWWNMRELLDPQYGYEVCLPFHEELALDLSTPKWEMGRNAVVKIESKASIAKRIGRSTDYGDAVCLAFWTPSRGGGVVF